MVTARALVVSGRISCHSIQKQTVLLNGTRSTSSKAKSNDHNGNSATIQRMRTKLADREFFETVIGASATKRDAKNFLAKFDKSPKQSATTTVDIPETNARVNLGSLYRPNKAVTDSPIFSFKPTDEQLERGDNTLNVAVVKVYEPQKWTEEILSGVAKTLAQLSRLGVRIIVVIDYDLDLKDVRITRKNIYQYAKSFTDTLNNFNDNGARLVDQSFSVDEDSGEVTLTLQSLLLSPLRQGAITVIPPLAHTQGWKTELIAGNQLVLALTKSLITDETVSQNPWPLEVSLNRIIFLDDAGGISDLFRSHVFVNLVQDFDEIYQNLKLDTRKDVVTTRQAGNLATIRKALSQLPPTASALFATPLEVALSVKPDVVNNSTPGVSTRPPRNTLIHNILTDKPLVSSSLPEARTHSGQAGKANRTSTFFKYGMPISIVPNVDDGLWANPGPNGTTLDLRSNPNIDLPRLVYLIEDSFGRKLDVDSYLKRIKNHIAGVIIVGDYEGGAILTWEKPRDRPNRPLVPYLDKFAVLRRCQGSGGVADIVFNAMVRQCFPDGVVWRSRRENPVNKWYFERSNGTWKLPGSNWTMFWTGSEVEMDADGHELEAKVERWKDYVAVCSNIQPSWADSKSKQ